MTASGPPVAPIGLGWVARSTARVLFRRFRSLLLLGLPFVWLPTLVVENVGPDSATLQFAANLMSLVFVGGGTFLTCRELAAEPASVRDAIDVGALLWGELWIVSAVTAAAALLGLVLFVAPVVFWVSACVPAVSVVVVENVKAPEALERGWALSRGSRGRIAVLAAAAALLIGVVFGAAYLSDWLAAGLFDETIVDAVWSYGVWPSAKLFAFAVMTVGSATVYAALRLAKEGSIGQADASFR